MAWIRTEEEVDAMIEDMIKRTKGRYISQGVSFSKTCPKQLALLKQALLSSVSFSGLGKELLAEKFFGQESRRGNNTEMHKVSPPIEKKDFGNFT